LEGWALPSDSHSEGSDGLAVRPVVRRVATALLFVVGVTLGAVLHVGHGASSPGSAAVRAAAWLALPSDHGVVTPVLTAPPTTGAGAAAPTTTPPPPAGHRSDPVATTTPADPPAVADRVSAALGRISYPWQQLGYRIVFLGPQPGLWGRTSQRSLSTIEIYVRPDESVDMLAHVIAHEIGHAVDLVYGNDQRRSLWLELRGISPRPWFTCSMCQDFTTPAGDFAEVFAYWQLGDFSRSQLAPPPTPAQLSQLLPLFSPPPPPA
jgi:hypothetical protein